jgi:hypothetical protein
MTPSYSLIMVRRWGLICLVAILAALSNAFMSFDGEREAMPSASIPAAVTPIPESEVTSQAPGEDDASTQSSEDNGDIIRQRIITIMITAIAITAGLLLLLWAYVTVGDPFRRRRAASRIRQLRREERKSRLRRRRRQ